MNPGERPGLVAALYPHWVAATAVALGFHLALAPVLLAGRSQSVALIYALGPAYMVHQIEEHRGDRFRRFVNARFAPGSDVLTRRAVLAINLPGVWGLNLAALYAAWLCGPGWGLAAPWLVMVNAMGHIGAGIALRVYNPGLATSLLLFLPLGIWTLYAVPATPLQQAVGLGSALLIHAAIIFHIARRARRAA